MSWPCPAPGESVFTAWHGARSGIWGLLWVPGFLVRNSSKMQSHETCSGEGSLQTLLSLNKTQKSSRQADCSVRTRQGAAGPSEHQLVPPSEGEIREPRSVERLVLSLTPPRRQRSLWTGTAGSGTSPAAPPNVSRTPGLSLSSAQGGVPPRSRQHPASAQSLLSEGPAFREAWERTPSSSSTRKEEGSRPPGWRGPR